MQRNSFISILCVVTTIGSCCGRWYVNVVRGVRQRSTTHISKGNAEIRVSRIPREVRIGNFCANSVSGCSSIVQVGVNRYARFTLLRLTKFPCESTASSAPHSTSANPTHSSVDIRTDREHIDGEGIVDRTFKSDPERSLTSIRGRHKVSRCLLF